MYFIPSHPTYFQTTSIVLGKLYSNTMMVVLNSRMTISRDTSLTGLSSMMSTRRSAFTSHRGISVTQQQWMDPLELEDNKKVGIITQTLILIMIFCLGPWDRILKE
jgi:hypothetical protein